MTIRIGIAGCGSHAMGRIVPLLVANPEFGLEAVWTGNAARHQQLRERGVAGVFSDFEELLAADVDVVYIASPTGHHFAHAEAALRSGRHVWVEKPLAATLTEARQLVALAERNERMLAECFMFTWHAQAAALRQTLARELSSEPRLVTLTFGFPHLPADNIRYDPALGGGAWLDHACYLVKALDMYFPGEWRLLGGRLEHDGHAVDVRGAALLRRGDGLLANLNWGFGQSYVNELQVLGEHERILVESAFTKPSTRSCDIVIEDSSGQRSTVAVPPENPFERMLEGLARDLQRPASWPALRQELLAHAERFFALYDTLEGAPDDR